MSGNSFAVVTQWRAGTGENTIIGTEAGADIDLASFYHAISPLDTMFSNYRRGCQLVYASASTLTVEAGEVMLSNSDGSVRLMQKNTSAITAAWTMIDTSTEAASTTYYIWAYQETVGDSDFDIAISTSSTAPSGKTYYKKLGSFYNNASSNITLITNDEPEELQVYDSGWFAVAADTTYVKTHSLGTTKVLAVFYLASDSSGTHQQVGQYDYDRNGKLTAITATSITLATDSLTNVFPDTSFSNYWTPTYAKIIMISVE